jgi:hypothetical protein
MMDMPPEEFHFAGMPFHWQADPNDPTVWLSDKAVLLTQLSGAGDPQVVDMTAPADSRVVDGTGVPAEAYAALIVSDDPHDTITVGTGLTVKIRTTVAGWLPTQAEQSLSAGTWKLKKSNEASGEGGGSDVELTDVTEDTSKRRDGRSFYLFGKVHRKTQYTFKATIPATQSTGLYDVVWTDAFGTQHPPLPDQVRIVHPTVIMLCLDGMNGELFQEALQEAAPGSGLDLVFGTAREPGKKSSGGNHAGGATGSHAMPCLATSGSRPVRRRRRSTACRPLPGATGRRSSPARNRASTACWATASSAAR